MNFHHLIKERLSVRKFKPQKVSDVLIKQVVEAGIIAPSAVNYQPWIIVIISDERVLSDIHAAYPREWFNKTKQIIAVCGDHNQSWKRKHDHKDHCDIDVAIAVDHMTLMATELGLGTCWVCNFDPEMVSKALRLPQNIEPVALLPIGYPDVETNGIKNRKSYNDIVFQNYYSKQ